MAENYSAFAAIYDRLILEDIDYTKIADYIEATLKRLGIKAELVCDLACGTGTLTDILSKRGYDMIGIDLSTEMLNVAREKNPDILFLNQDICEFELYGTVDVTVSCLDCINHLTDTKSLKQCFALVHNYLIPNGLFIFDINGKYKFENTYSDNSYVMEEDGRICIWQNYYNQKNKICDFYITLFEETSDGRYKRYDDMQREKMYTVRSIKENLVKCGFEFIGAYRNFDFDEATDGDERIYVVARCIKE